MQTYNLKPELVQAIKQAKFTTWTPIQERSLSLANHDKNFLAISPTGTGKTLAYLLPVLNRIDVSQKTIQSIIVVPTRELARQVYNVLKMFKQTLPQLKASLFIGGLDLNKLIHEANYNAGQIVITTPQRFLDIAKELPNQVFSHVNSFVLDEADMLMDLNFYPQIHEMIKKFDFEHVYKIAASATLHNMLNDELSSLFKNVTVVNLNQQDINQQNVQHYIVKTTDKDHALFVLINQLNPYLCIVFANTTKKADEIYKKMLEAGCDVINLHSKLQSRARKNNFNRVKDHKYQYVVASDLFSRGMDIEGASHIINYDLPETPEWYIHRSGRTGRGKYTGVSYVLFKNTDQDRLQKIINKKINFQVKKIKDNELVDSKLDLKPKKKTNEKQEAEIKKVISLSSKVVKPGYKKKLKEKINKIKQKNKRKHIEKLVREQKIKRYKNQQN